ncbi:MAG: hypothetical protein BWZ07_00860 [Alphaproteobacteria bacterium ADurb.BinA280]|nr:MAG: hypothetical protein BWZ07_00860 [Alphaproteobacteria bacterium ADurb.BinA280]
MDAVADSEGAAVSGAGPQAIKIAVKSETPNSRHASNARRAMHLLFLFNVLLNILELT